jgi:ABC-type glycerol-3-phosphate transport system substrate-binding protein
MSGRRPKVFIALIGAVVASTAVLGCSERAPDKAAVKKSAAPPAAVNLTVVVAGDDELAEGVRLLRGEWKARSGGELSVEAIGLDELAKAEPLAADLVVFPSRLLGALAEQSQLRPIRDSVLESAELGLNDIFPALRNGEMRYGGQTLALPLGSPPLLAYWRPHLAGEESPDGWPPKTWEEYRRWINAGAASAKPTAPPLEGRAAAFTLIARALAYTEQSRRAEALFNAEDMTPRITDPPFVRALAELREEASNHGGQKTVDFAGGTELVRSGNALATLGWPSPAPAASPAANEAAAAAVFAPLPPAEQVFSQNQQRWENQTFPQSVSLLGVEGRLVGVCQASRNAVSAFKLCQWLTTGDIAVQLSSRSRGTLWFRSSQAGAYGQWSGDERSGELSAPVTEVVAKALDTETPVMIPRIPAVDEYVDLLAEAVRLAEPGEEGATAALKAAAEKWEALTERLGREAQARSFRRHLGVDAIETE